MGKSRVVVLRWTSPSREAGVPNLLKHMPVTKEALPREKDGSRLHLEASRPICTSHEGWLLEDQDSERQTHNPCREQEETSRSSGAHTTPPLAVMTVSALGLLRPSAPFPSSGILGPTAAERPGSAGFLQGSPGVSSRASKFRPIVQTWNSRFTLRSPPSAPSPFYFCSHFLNPIMVSPCTYR